MALNDNPVDAQVIAKIITLLSAIDGTPNFYYDLENAIIAEEILDFNTINTFPAIIVKQGNMTGDQNTISAQTIYMEVDLIAILEEHEDQQLRCSRLRHDIVKAINSNAQLDCLALDSEFQSSEITVIEEMNGISILSITYLVKYRHAYTDPTVNG